MSEQHVTCPRCRYENRRQAKFCEACGTALERRCLSCNSEIPAAANFCPQCGQRATGADDRKPGVASPRSYTPRHLAEQIVASKSALEGERKHVTVLFCDIVESSKLAEAFGPEAMHELLDRVLQIMASAVHRYEGTVNQFLGDGLMALFGAPRALEDHPQRAVQAAFEIREMIAKLAEELKRERDVDIRLRMAINTGPVVVGKIGDDLRMDYTAVGDTTNVAAHLEQVAEPGTILLSEATYRLVQRDVRTERVGPIRIKGKSEPVPAFRALGFGSSLSASEWCGRHTLREFLGRERELAALRDLLAQAEHGHGQLVGLVGEPGVGKSRLLFEFRRELAAGRVQSVEGRCLSYATAIPYLPVVHVLREQCGITNADMAAAVTAKVRDALSAVGLDREEHAPYLLWVLGAKEGMDRLELLSPGAVKERTFEVVWQFSLRLSRRQPMILAVEDAQWIDKTSEELLSFLAEHLGDAPILMISTYRPGYRPPWLSKSYASQIALPRLSREDSLRLVHSMPQSKTIADHVAQAILTKAEGNPFFLEELARAMLEHGDLLPTHAVPNTIQAVLMARIDRLPDRIKRLLQTASVLGREFSLRLISAVWEDHDVVAADLVDLVRREFLYERTGSQEAVYVFKHALTQEVAYDSLVTRRRQTVHAAAGRALEMLYADRLDEVYDLLAHHYSKADQADKAIEYLTRLARKVARGHSHVEAVAALTEALAHAERLPAETRYPCLLDLVLRQGQSLNFLGRNRESLDILLRQRDRVERLADPSRASPYYFSLGINYGLLGDQERAVESLDRSIVEAKRCGDERTMGRAYALRTLQTYWSGQPLQGIEYGRQAVTLLERTQQHYWLGLAYFYIATVHFMIGDFEAAVKAATQANAVGEALGHSGIQSYGRLTTGMSKALMCEWDTGISECRRALELSPDPLTTGIATGILGYAHLEKGEVARAIALLEEATRTMHRFEYRQNQGWFTVGLAEAHSLNGQAEKARDLALHGLHITEEAKFAFGVGIAERGLGRIARVTGDLGEAETYLSQAMRTFGSIPARFELARTYMDLALAARARNDHQRFAAHLEEAHRLFCALKLAKNAERTRALAAESGMRLGQ